MKKIKVVKKPFFFKFLEAQKVVELKDLKGGAGHYGTTMKYPSDGDDDGPNL